jgi:hypothetical protein
MNRDKSTTAIAIVTGVGIVTGTETGTGNETEIVTGTARTVLVHLRLRPARRIDRSRQGDGQRPASRIVDRHRVRGGMEFVQTILQ